MMSWVRGDLRLVLRRLLRRPMLPAIAVSVFAVGLSASVGAFSYLNTFRRPFPGVNSDGLVRLFDSDPENPFLDISYLDFEDYRSSGLSLDGIAASQPFFAASVRHEEMTEVAFLEAVSGSYFEVLQVDVAEGRGIQEGDDRAGSDPVAVISHAWWQRRWNGDPGVIGQTLYLNYRPFTIVGVAARDFLGTASEFRPDVWIPIAPFRDRYTSWDVQAKNRDVPLVRVYGRLGIPGDEGRVTSELSGVARGLDELYPGKDSPRRPRLTPATWIDPRARVAEAGINRILAGVVLGFLVLVCANVANLLLALSRRRRRAAMLQSALGASPGRLLRQGLLEGVLLAALGGLVALALALPLGRRVGAYFARPSVWGADVAREINLDGSVLLFAVLAAVAAGLLAGAIPAWKGSVINLAQGLKGGASAPPRRWMGVKIPSERGVLVAVQVSVAMVLVVVSGLCVRSLSEVKNIEPGFDYSSLMVSHVSTSSTGIQVEERQRWFHDLADAISREPWVESATISQNSPLSPHPAGSFRIEGRAEPEELVVAPVHADFFEVMGIRVLEGRPFEPGDTTGAPPVAIVNQPASEMLFPEGGAVGRHIWRQGEGGGSESGVQVVGVVGQVRVRDLLRDPEPAVYLPFTQQAYGSGAGLVVRTRDDPAGHISDMETWLRVYEPHMAIVNVLPYTDVARGFAYAQRMNAEMFSVLALFALVLAAAGILGVVSLEVVDRVREIGIRMAVGGRGPNVVLRIVSHSILPVAAGLLVGLGGSLVAGSMLTGILYGIDPWDVPLLLGSAGLLFVVALVAAYLPARRAGKVDPILALRAD